MEGDEKLLDIYGLGRLIRVLQDFDGRVGLTMISLR